MRIVRSRDSARAEENTRKNRRRRSFRPVVCFHARQNTVPPRLSRIRSIFPLLFFFLISGAGSPRTKKFNRSRLHPDGSSVTPGGFELTLTPLCPSEALLVLEARSYRSRVLRSRCTTVFIGAAQLCRNQCLCSNERTDRRKGEPPWRPRLSGFDARNRKRRLPIIICNRGRKGESETRTVASTTGYADCQVPRRYITRLSAAAFTPRSRHAIRATSKKSHELSRNFSSDLGRREEATVFTATVRFGRFARFAWISK